MNLLTVLNSPWAILPDNYVEVRDIYLSWKAGERADLSAIEAKLGRPLDNVHVPYSIENPGPDGRGTAVIPIQGVIARRMNILMDISGGTSTQLLGQDFMQAVNDPQVHSILLVVNSPGGQVDGIQELAQQIRAARGPKPIIALAEGVTASAAYWLAAAADQIFASSETTQVGSIGVIAQHRDVTKADEMKGEKITLITSGGQKGLLNEHVPLTPESGMMLKEIVDQIYGVFVAEVAASRGVSRQDVLDRMAEGKLFLAGRAVEAGLIDGIASYGQVLNSLAAHAARQNQMRVLGAAAAARLEILNQ